MSAETDALFGAMQHYILEGHTFVFSPAMQPHAAMPVQVRVQVSGPTGSRTARGATATEALEALIVQIVSARLEGTLVTTPTSPPGPFDDLPPDSYF